MSPPPSQKAIKSNGEAMASRSLDDLKPEFRERAEVFLGFCADAGLNILVYCTLRDNREQAIHYRCGRGIAEILHKRDELEVVWKRPDLAKALMDVGPQFDTRVRTYAGPGQSLHLYGFALDACPLQGGKLPWADGEDAIDAALWTLYGKAAEAAGLEWGGNWSERKREMPHVQMPGVKWEELIAMS